MAHKLSGGLNIAIVGAGFAGLASALLLARAGHRVSVFEKFKSPQSLGAGILIQPSGLAALQRLGIHDHMVEQGARVLHLHGIHPGQRPVVDVRYAHWRPDAYGLGLHRGVLFDALWQAAQQEGVQITTGVEVTQLAALQARHDLTVVADGAGSVLRAQTGLPVRDRLYPWGAAWAVLDDPGRRYGHTLWQWYRGAHQMLGIMPTGLTPARSGTAGRPVVSLFWSLRADSWTAWRDAGLEAFKQQVRALNPDCEDLLAQLVSLEQLTWARYHDVVMPGYHTPDCVVIGDAAHATSPQLGQGTNLALLDAVALADCLGPAGGPTAPPLPLALARYTACRRRHLHYYGQASRWLTPLFQSDLRLLPWLRDRLMARSLRWPVVGPLNLQTLVGVRQSWWPGAPVLELPQPPGITRAR
ncbi:MAG: FAD-dependent monooxygenase [Ramlibacter sp.]|nr:FAD-dependent monooxygenase [Ramlibacter sp.]MBX3659962.1 FAD-dependent monooxygenase [Ramlibacter sp.]